MSAHDLSRSAHDLSRQARFLLNVSVKSFHRIAIRSLVVAVACLQLVASSCAANDTDKQVNLTPGNKTNFQVESRMEVKGTLYLDPTEETRSVSMNVQANYRYGERLATKPDLIKAIRYYEQADSNIKLSTGSTTATLSDSNRYLIMERRSKPVADKRVRFQSPQATLTEPELNLINVPCNSMLLSKWIEAKNVKINDEWTTDNDLLADILTWDIVKENKINAKLVDISSGIAKISLSGTAIGLIDDSESEVTIEGTCSFELQQGYVSNVRMKISENRDAGIIAPGFKADIWLENDIVPTNLTRLTNAALGQLRMHPNSRADLLLLDVECGPYRIPHQRHWRVTSNRQDRTVMRCVRDGVVLGQCDIVPLPNQPAGAPVSLDQFQINVQKAVTNTDGEVVNGQQSPSISQQKWMRVDAVGKSNEIQMRWIYFTITAPDLRRVQMLFTLEEAAFDEFKGFEQELINSIEFNTQATQPDGDDRSATSSSSSRR